MDAVCILRRSEILSATIDGIVIWCTCPIVIGPEVHAFDIHGHKDTEFRSQLGQSFPFNNQKNAKNNGW